MERADRFPDIRLWLGGTLALTLGCLLLLARALNEAGVLQTPRWLAVMAAGALAAALQVGLLAVIWQGKTGGVQTGLWTVYRGLQRLGKANLVIYLVLAAMFSWLALGRYGQYFSETPMRILMYLLAAVAGALLLAASGVKGSWKEFLAGSLLLLAAAFRIFLYSGELSTRPISLNWSEASRFYYASLFFSEQIYGVSVPPTVLHPSRYLMQALPFLIPGLPLWVHRLWQVILWVAVTAASAGLLVRRLNIHLPLRRWMVATWAFIFLLIGPVYYHLQVPLILVLWLFDRRRFWRSLAVVAVASIWAGISRVNWFPAAGLLAAALYFMEEPVARQPPWRYLARPAAWAVGGLALAFAAQAAYAIGSGNPAEQFASSLTSDLLWYRLLPNITYPAGVLLMAALVCAPIILLAWLHHFERGGHAHLIRLLGLGSILLILLGGGLVVSVKIGGGSNLHNLDVFLAFLMIVAAYLVFDRMAPEPAAQEQPPQNVQRRSLDPRLIQAAWGLALLVPVYLTIIQGGPPESYDRAAVERDLARLSRFTNEAAQEGEVLFISQRHLLTFGLIDGISLVPEYEKVFLMEMAMAGDPAYLGRFWQDLQNHRFSMIVTDPLFLRYKGVTDSFGEENDAWVKNVSVEILCYYEHYRNLRGLSLQLLIPRPEGKPCPTPLPVR